MPEAPQRWMTVSLDTQIAGVVMHVCHVGDGLGEQVGERMFRLIAQIHEKLETQVPDVPRRTVHTAVGRVRRPHPVRRSEARFFDSLIRSMDR